MISPRDACRVPCRDVRNFVRHNSGHLSFVVGVNQDARVDEEEAARKCEGIDFIAVDHFDGERNFGVGITDQVLADAIHVLGDDGVIDDLRLTFDFLGHLLAEADLFFD